MAPSLIEKWLSPEKLFRIVIVLCLVGMGLAMIYGASHISQLGPPPLRLWIYKDLTSYLFTGLGIFVFFYAQYRLVPRYTRVALNERLGYVQSLGGALLLVVGAVQTAVSQASPDLPSRVLYWLAVLGEGIFIGNIVWSYTHAYEALPVPPAGPKKRFVERVGDEGGKNLGWPKSPVELFAICTGLFAIGGLISLLSNFPSFRFPVPWSGETHTLPFGLLWLSCAAPFAIFTFLYWFFIHFHGLVFEESMNRIHFWVTIAAVFDLVRVFAAWEQALVSTLAAFYFGPEFRWLYVLFGLSALVFGISAFRSYRQSSSRR